MTGRKARPYHFPCFSDVASFVGAPVIRRLALMPPLFVLHACASESASKAEVVHLQAELRAQREENAVLRRRLEERDSAPTPVPVRAYVSRDEPPEVPALTVVKLKPKAEPAPKIDTAVSVFEPAPESVDEILQAGSRSDGALEEQRSPANPSAAEGEFQEGMAALNTGNLSGGIARLQKFAAENPRHPKADNALYFSGVGLIGLGQYERAASSFERVISGYPAGDALKDAMLKLAECRARLNRPSSTRASIPRFSPSSGRESSWSGWPCRFWGRRRP